MDIANIALIIVILVILTIILYIATALASGEWRASTSIWIRLVIVAAVATFIIPLLQLVAAEVNAQDTALLIAFLVILLLVKILIVTELPVSDEWPSALFVSIVTVLLAYVIQKVLTYFLNIEVFSFIG